MLSILFALCFFLCLIIFNTFYFVFVSLLFPTAYLFYLFFCFPEMSEIKYKNQILAAIDHLRSRKSRPDINRICKFMLKCYKVLPKDTKADLKCCLKEKSIFKVDYKDNVSYRNAAKWRKRSYQNNSELNLVNFLKV